MADKKFKSKLEVLKLIENYDEGLSMDEIIDLCDYFDSNPSFIEQYKEFYDDIKTKVREDW